MGSTVSCLLYFIVILQVALASQHTVRLTFHKYLNPNNGSVASPDCCDRGPVSQTCYVPCETIITICLENIGYDSTCSLTQTQSSGIIASSDIEFDGTVGTLPNPVVFQLDTIPQEGVQAYILIEDDDLGPFDDDPLANTVDMIDEVFITIPGGSSPSVQTYTGLYDIAQVDLEYEVVCDEDHYGTDCSIVCEPMDDNVNGHYTCDPITGAKICLDNYIDPATNCLQSIVQPTQINPTTTSYDLHTSSTTFSRSFYDSNIQATRSKTTTDIISIGKTGVMDKETVNSGGKNIQTAITLPSASTTKGVTDTSTGKNSFGIMAGVVGSIALAMALSLGLIVICTVMFVFRRHKTSQAKAAPGKGSSGGDFVVINDPSINEVAGSLANPVYSGVNLALYQELQPQTMTKKGVYMTLNESNRNQKHDTSTKPTNATITIRDNVQYDNAVVAPNMRPINSNSKQQDYACLYETPIDGALLSGKQIFTVLRPEATKTAMDYQEPADSIAPCGQILISMESTIPVQ